MCPVLANFEHRQKFFGEVFAVGDGLDTLRESFGDDRILYGSNYPVSDFMAAYVDVFSIVTDYFQAN